MGGAKEGTRYLGGFFTIFYDPGVVFNLSYCGLKGVKRREGGDYWFRRYETIFLWGELREVPGILMSSSPYFMMLGSFLIYYIVV